MRLFRHNEDTSAKEGVGTGGDARVLLDQTAATVTAVVDGSSYGWDALDWAAAEAAVRGRALRIVHVLTWPWSLDPFGNLTVGVADRHVRETAQSVLDAAVERARSVAPSLQVTAELQVADQGTSVRPQGPDDLIVVGRQLRLGRLDRLAAASARRLALRSSVPVIVVRLADAESHGPSTGRVLVGLDGDAGTARILDFAFRAARRRGIGLTVLHVSGIRDQVASENVDNALRLWRAAFPDVNVQIKIAPGLPAQALVDESSGAALVVLGSPKHGRLHQALFGSVAGGVLRSAGSPVVIVR